MIEGSFARQKECFYGNIGLQAKVVARKYVVPLFGEKLPDILKCLEFQGIPGGI